MSESYGLFYKNRPDFDDLLYLYSDVVHSRTTLVIDSIATVLASMMSSLYDQCEKGKFTKVLQQFRRRRRVDELKGGFKPHMSQPLITLCSTSWKCSSGEGTH